MTNYRGWYFKDWKSELQVTADGRKRYVYYYVGPYYLLPEKALRFKLSVLAAAVLYLAGFVVLNFFPSPCGRLPQLAGMALLGIIPILCLIAGLPALLRTKNRRMTHRRFHRAIIRLRWAAVLAALIALAHLVMEIVFLVRGGFAPGGEAGYLAVIVLELALSAAGAFRLLKMPFPTEYPDPGEPRLTDD